MVEQNVNDRKCQNIWIYVVSSTLQKYSFGRGEINLYLCHYDGILFSLKLILQQKFKGNMWH